jgi:hypothetical protein
MEGWRETDGARTHCNFCHQLLSGESQISEAAKSHAPRPQTTINWRYATLGGLCGAGVGLVITSVYFGYALLMSVLTLMSGRVPAEEQPVVVEVVRHFAIRFLMGAIVGGGLGISLMVLAGIVLQGRPRVLRAGAIGALVGSLPLPVLVFVLFVMPAIAVDGLDSPDMPAIFARNWLLSLAAAFVGAIAGLAAFAGITAREDDQEPSA